MEKFGDFSTEETAAQREKFMKNFSGESDKEEERWTAWIKAKCPAKGTEGKDFNRYLEHNDEKYNLLKFRGSLHKVVVFLGS